mmetsp:Transcript_28299/g.60326  ORF Transcript_28299/g.60326 Transcript_28299/m.60326 type:complete len:100 (+) Transcript_28299:231-530(+)
MHLVSQSLLIFLVWSSNSEVTTAIHASSSSRQWNQRQRSSRAHHHHHTSACQNEGKCRQLSAKDQLDILRLGFIPTSRDDDKSKPSDNVMTHYFRLRSS